MILQTSLSYRFKNGSVHLIRFVKYQPSKEFYIVQRENEYDIHPLKKTWVGQIIQVFILRIKFK